MTKSCALRAAPRFRDQRLVAAMHAVEIAHGDDGAFIGVRHVAMVTEYLHEMCQAFGRAGAITSASPSTTVTSPTLQTQSNSTRRLSATTSRTVQVAVIVSPMRTGALKRVVRLMKIVPGPGIFMPSTVEI